jgi:ubiquinone/menaquinone biosynthesis C-methylase UbiE
VAGIDYSAAQLAAAKSSQLKAPSWMGEPAPLALARGDAARLPFRDGSFDLVYCRYLLEHVADPAAVLHELRRVTQPGGRVHAQENDLRALTLHPEVPSFSAAWSAFCDLQIELGGNPWIGRKLHALFLQAGFTELEASIAPEIHSAADPRACLQDWTDNLIGNLESAKERLLSTARLTPAAWTQTLSDLGEWRKRPDAALFFYWNRASAVK